MQIAEKFSADAAFFVVLRSLSVRGEWIEIYKDREIDNLFRVSPRVGRVD